MLSSSIISVLNDTSQAVDMNIIMLSFAEVIAICHSIRVSMIPLLATGRSFCV